MPESSQALDRRDRRLFIGSAATGALLVIGGIAGGGASVAGQVALVASGVVLVLVGLGYVARIKKRGR